MRRRPDICRLKPLKASAWPRAAAPEPAHHLAEDVLEAADSASARAASARATKSFRPPGETLKMGVAAAKSRRPAAGKAMKARPAFRIDLPRVEEIGRASCRE